MCNMMLKKYVQENNLEDKVTVLDKKPDELSLVDLGGVQVQKKCNCISKLYLGVIHTIWNFT